MKLGEFKKQLENLPDDLEVFFYTDYFNCMFQDSIEGVELGSHCVTLRPRVDVVKRLQQELKDALQNSPIETLKVTKEILTKYSIKDITKMMMGLELEK